MPRSRWWIAGAALVVAVALFLSRPTVAQPPAAANPPAQGRYQMQVVERDGVSTVFVLDTHTGQTWYRETRAGVTEWTDMASPAKDKK